MSLYASTLANSYIFTLLPNNYICESSNASNALCINIYDDPQKQANKWRVQSIAYDRPEWASFCLRRLQQQLLFKTVMTNVTGYLWLQDCNNGHPWTRQSALQGRGCGAKSRDIATFCVGYFCLWRTKKLHSWCTCDIIPAANQNLESKCHNFMFRKNPGAIQQLDGGLLIYL